MAGASVPPAEGPTGGGHEPAAGHSTPHPPGDPYLPGPTERRAAQQQSTPDAATPVTLSVIAPCLNEEGNVDALCDRVLAVFDRMASARSDDRRAGPRVPNSLKRIEHDPEPQASACAASPGSSDVGEFVVPRRLKPAAQGEQATPSFPPCQGGTEGGSSQRNKRESHPQAAVHATPPISAELILVDDGSTDATWRRIEHRSKLDARVRGVRHETNRGIVPSWHSGLAAARGELACLIDADLQNPPESIESLYQCFVRGGVDLVQGAREPVDYVFTRYALSKGLNFLLNCVFGMRLRDNKSGFVLARKDVLERSLDYRGRYRFAQCFITVFAHARGYRIGQVTTPFHCRRSGESFLTNLPIRVILKVLWEIARARVEVFALRRQRSRAQPEPQASACAVLRNSGV